MYLDQLAHSLVCTLVVVDMDSQVYPLDIHIGPAALLFDKLDQSHNPQCQCNQVREKEAL